MNLVFSAIRRLPVKDGISGKMLPAKVGLELLPILLRVAERGEERGFEPAHRVRWRQQIVAQLLGIDHRLFSVRKPQEEFSLSARGGLILFLSEETNGEGGIRTRPPRYILENQPLERNPLFCNELRTTIRYFAHTPPTSCVTSRIGQYVGQSGEVLRSPSRPL